MSPPSQPAPSTPSHTVMGSPAGKLLAAESSDDYSYARSYYWSCATASTCASAQKDSKGGGGFMSLGKSLTRKVSSRWRKVGGAIAAEGSSSNTCDKCAAVPNGETGAAPAAPDSAKGSIQRSGSASTEETPTRSALEVGKERIKKMRSRYSMRISVDRNLKPADMKTPASPTPSIPTPGTPTSLDRGRVPRRLVKPRPSGSSADPSLSSGLSTSLSPSASAPSSEKASSSRLWKLMKRISTGGLRDKYHSHSPSKSHLSNYSEESLSHTSSTHGPPPPVPALPKSFQTLLPVLSPATCSEGGHDPRTADISNSAQVNASQNRIVDKDRSVSSPLPTESRQKKTMQRIRPISSVGILRRQRSMTNGIAASTSASVSGTIPTRTTTPSGQTKPKLPSRPSTARSLSPVSSESTRFFGSSLFGGSRSIRSRCSSISSLDEANGQHIHHHHLPLHNHHPHLPPNHHQYQIHKQQQHQQQNNSNSNGNNGPVSVPPVPTNILAKHILPPGALMREEVKTGQNTAENRDGRRRKEKKESVSTGAGASLMAQNGSGSTNGNGVSSMEASAGNSGSPYMNGVTKGLPTQGIVLHPRSATMPALRLSGVAGSARNPPSPGRSTSLGGDEWSIAQSPEFELPSLPFPPRKRGVSEKAKRDNDAVDGGDGNTTMQGRRSRSSTAAVSPVSSPSLSPVPSISYSSNVGEAEENVTPGLSTFGRVMGKQFGMERMENPSTVSISGSVSSLSSISASSSLGSRSELSLHGRMSVYGSISGKTRHHLSMSSRIGKSSASAVSRSYSLPSSPDMPSQSQPSLPPLTLMSQPHPPVPGTLNMLMRKLSFSNGSALSVSSSSSAAPARPARNPRRPSVSPILRGEGTGKEKEQSSNGNGSGKVLRKTSVGERHRPILSNGGSTSASSPSNADHDAECSSNHEKSQNKLPYPLTEREKREKWEDLLERSDRAGGTIHLNADGEGLLSDRMLARISAVSLATTVGTQEREDPQGE